MKKKHHTLWSFRNFEKQFDKHILNSIPGYAEFWWYGINLSKSFISNKTVIYDLGCSTGKKTNLIYKNLKNIKSLEIIGVDIEKSMINYANKKYSNKQTKFKNSKLDKLNFKKANIFFCMFTFNFLSIEERYKVLKKIYNSLKEGGAVFYADKVIDINSSVEVLINQVHSLWKQNYFTKSQILEKQEQIRGIMQPLKEDELTDLFTKTGFKKNLILKNLNFNFYLLKKY
jgi:tRNA (cmo5U34)-methyltransferase